MTIEVFLLHLPFREKCRFLWLAGVYAVLWDIWGERSDKVFRGRERDPCEVWSLARFHVFLWVLILKIFCNYSIGIFLSWNPIF